MLHICCGRYFRLYCITFSNVAHLLWQTLHALLLNFTTVAHLLWQTLSPLYCNTLLMLDISYGRYLTLYCITLLMLHICYGSQFTLYCITLLMLHICYGRYFTVCQRRLSASVSASRCQAWIPWNNVVVNNLKIWMPFLVTAEMSQVKWPSRLTQGVSKVYRHHKRPASQKIFSAEGLETQGAGTWSYQGHAPHQQLCGEDRH